MPMTANLQRAKHNDEQKIAKLEAKIERLQKQVESNSRPDLPVLKEIPRVQSRLRKFAQNAVNYGRADLANSTMAFIAGLERTLNESGVPRRRAKSTADE